MNILMVLTSHDQLGNTGHKTGFWLKEFAAPYYVFEDAGAKLTLASPLGGKTPLDPKSDDAASIALIDAMIAAGKPVAAVCHAPGVLRHAPAPSGQPLVKGKNPASSEPAAKALLAKLQPA